MLLAKSAVLLIFVEVTVPSDLIPCCTIGTNTGQPGVNSSLKSSNRLETRNTQKKNNPEEEDPNDKPDSKLERIKQSAEQENSDGQQTDGTNKPGGSNKPVILTEKDVKELRVEITNLKDYLKKDSLKEKEDKRKTEKDLKEFLCVEITKVKEDLIKESLDVKEEKSKTESDLKEFLSVEIKKVKEDLKKESLEEKEEKTKRSRKTMPQPFSFTVCVTSFFWIGWSYFYSNYWISPELTELASQYRYFCNVSKLTDEECFQRLISERTNPLYGTDTFNYTTNHTSQIGNLSTNICSLHEETKGMKSGQTSLAQKLNETEILIKNLTVKLNSSKTLNNLTDRITNLINAIGRQRLQVDVVREIQEYTDHIKADKGITYLVAIILGIGELCIFVVFCTKGEKQVGALRQTTENNYPAGDANMSNDTESVLEEIQRKTDLENSLCIVSFHDSSQAKHYKMVNSFIDSKIKQIPFLVNRHGDLKVIPASKICMVFVDYNQRDIILESERELGDLKKTTVKAIWKIGGNVVLVYCGNKTNAEVTDNALYNQKLKSIKLQEELKQLEAKQCVLSVNDYAFSDFQIKHLKDVVQRFFKQ